MEALTTPEFDAISDALVSLIDSGDEFNQTAIDDLLYLLDSARRQRMMRWLKLLGAAIAAAG